MPDDDRVLAALRNMAWERAKGELRSMLWTYYGTYDTRVNRYTRLDDAVKAFVKQVEDGGLHE